MTLGKGRLYLAVLAVEVTARRGSLRFCPITFLIELFQPQKSAVSDAARLSGKLGPIEVECFANLANNRVRS